MPGALPTTARWSPDPRSGQQTPTPNPGSRPVGCPALRSPRPFGQWDTQTKNLLGQGGRGGRCLHVGCSCCFGPLWHAAAASRCDSLQTGLHCTSPGAPSSSLGPTLHGCSNCLPPHDRGDRRRSLAGRASYGASVAFRYGNDFGNNRYDQSTRCALESFVDSVAQAGGNSLRVWLFVEGRDLPAGPPLACLSVPRANVGMHICMPRVVLHVVKCMPHVVSRAARPIHPDVQCVWVRHGRRCRRFTRARRAVASPVLTLLWNTAHLILDSHRLTA